MHGLIVTDAKKWEEAIKSHHKWQQASCASLTAHVSVRFSEHQVKVEHKGMSWSVHTLNLEVGSEFHRFSV